VTGRDRTDAELEAQLDADPDLHSWTTYTDEAGVFWVTIDGEDHSYEAWCNEPSVLGEAATEEVHDLYDQSCDRLDAREVADDPESADERRASLDTDAATERNHGGPNC